VLKNVVPPSNKEYTTNSIMDALENSLKKEEN
jgi:hypothetical protein